MDNFRAVYHILSELEKALDSPKVDISRCDAEQLGVSENRWCSYIEMMEDVGYIKGAVIKRNIYGETLIDCDNMKITLKGLEYLQENSVMQRIYKTLKGIKEVTPKM
ncbi:MAG: YjcQ family protein [Clostridium sp.]|nr:YjcQ family protein [Clostridium sp.]